MEAVPLRYFSAEDLEPLTNPTEKPQSLLSSEAVARLTEFADTLRNNSRTDMTLEHLRENPDLTIFVSILVALGALRVTSKGDSLELEPSGDLACDVGLVLIEYFKGGYCIFEDWFRRYKTQPDRVSAIEFLYEMELQRIEHSTRMGKRPKVFEIVPVSFAVIKAHSERRNADVYLLEFNADWHRYNFIGGKQQKEDGNSFEHTVLREIQEELGIPEDQIKLTALLKTPLVTHSLTGYRGVLSSYPCVLYQAHFTHPIQIRQTDIWVSDKELEEMVNGADARILLNPIYAKHILHEMRGGLEALPSSFAEPIEPLGRLEKLWRWFSQRERWVYWIAAVITIGGLLFKWGKDLLNIVFGTK